MDCISADYPDDFGGCYLDGNTLVIQVTNDEQKTKDFYLIACNNSKYVQFELVNYSYEELQDIQENKVEELKNVYNIAEYYVDVPNNAVNIGVTSDLVLAATIDEYDNQPVKLYFLDALPVATAMRGGEGIADGSICFFGKYNGKNALITCGHTNAVGKDMYYNGQKVGSVIKQNLRTYTDTDGIPSSYGDFSIVDISNSPISYSSSIKTKSGSINATGTANVVVGLNVKMYGNSTGYLSGTVKSTSVTSTFYEPGSYEQYKVKGMTTIEGSNTVQSGDSGGAVVYTTSSGVNRIAGSITGAKAGICSYITPSSYIEASGFSFN